MCSNKSNLSLFEVQIFIYLSLQTGHSFSSAWPHFLPAVFVVLVWVRGGGGHHCFNPFSYSEVHLVLTGLTYHGHFILSSRVIV